MKTVYLHIGTFKTGTTSIQRFLTANRERLAESGYFVPSSQLFAHHPLPLSLIRDHSDFKAVWRDFKGSSNALWQKLVSEIDDTACNNVIISSEGFCDLVNENCRDVSSVMGERVKNYLNRYKVVVVCYIREILPYISSMYRESIKVSTRTLSLEEEIDEFVKRKSIHLHPSIFLGFYAKLFGDESLIVKKYDRKELLNQDVVQDFLYTIGLGNELPSFSEKISRISDVNVSIRPEYIDLKRAFNIAGSEGQHFNRMISSLLINSTTIACGEGGQMKELLGEELFAVINAEQKKLNEKFGLSLNPAIVETISGNNVTRSGDYLFLVSLLAHNIKLNNQILARMNQRHSWRSLFKKLNLIPQKVWRLFH